MYQELTQAIWELNNSPILWFGFQWWGDFCVYFCITDCTFNWIISEIWFYWKSRHLCVWAILSLPPPAPEVPTIEQAYSKQSNSITVEFSEIYGATGYILRAESETEDSFSETLVTSSPGTVLHLQPYTEYSLSVMSVNSGGRSQPSHPIQTRTGTW